MFSDLLLGSACGEVIAIIGGGGLGAEEVVIAVRNLSLVVVSLAIAGAVLALPL
jgi:hypothetical protein